jgi:hypothetical protein
MIPRSLLKHWADMIASTKLRPVRANQFEVDDWTLSIRLPMKFEWKDAGFHPQKLKYLQRRYPPDALPDDGCIVSIRPGAVEYRRVDVIRGVLGDILYLQHLGHRGGMHFTCPGAAKLHVIRLSVVFPVIVRAGLFKGVQDTLRRKLANNVRHRMLRMYEAKYATVRRMNDWAHAIASEADMQAAIEVLS